MSSMPDALVAEREDLNAVLGERRVRITVVLVADHRRSPLVVDRVRRTAGHDGAVLLHRDRVKDVESAGVGRLLAVARERRVGHACAGETHHGEVEAGRTGHRSTGADDRPVLAEGDSVRRVRAADVHDDLAPGPKCAERAGSPLRAAAIPALSSGKRPKLSFPHLSIPSVGASRPISALSRDSTSNLASGMRRTTAGFICLGVALLATPRFGRRRDAEGAARPSSATAPRPRRRGGRRRGVDIARPRIRHRAAPRRAARRLGARGVPARRARRRLDRDRLERADRRVRRARPALRLPGMPHGRRAEGGPPRDLVRAVHGPSRPSRSRSPAMPIAGPEDVAELMTHWESTSRTRSAPTPRRSSFTRARSACGCRNDGFGVETLVPDLAAADAADRRIEARVAARGTALGTSQRADRVPPVRGLHGRTRRPRDRLTPRSPAR